MSLVVPAEKTDAVHAETDRVERILVVDDDVRLRTLLQRFLEDKGFVVKTAHDATQMDRLLQRELFSLIVLDFMLPVEDGLSICRRLRQSNIDTPIIMLTARGEEDHKVQGLDAGADDYMTKPFSTRELVSRIKAVLRRSNALGGEKTIDANGLILDPVSQRVSFGNTILEMGPTEYRLLAFFMTHPERAYTRAQLLDQVWGGNVYIEDRTIDVHIRRLRKVLEPFNADRYVQTVRGTGYRFSTRADAVLG